MQQRPQRPFVPHRTPKASRPVTTRSEFRLSRPFVPGQSREEAEIAPQPVVEIAPARQLEREQLPPIGVFLDDDASPESEESQELPPVEHFLDPLPEVASFAPDAEGALMEESSVSINYAPSVVADSPPTESGWGVEDWQQYDWRAAATLGDGAESQASNEWATTDWDVGRTVAGKDKKPSAAQAIANALDQIAQQIREGDLTLPSTGEALTDPRAIAASLAALLGVRR